MNSRRMRMIAELMKHLEELDGNDLKGGMNPPADPMAAMGEAEPDGDEGGVAMMAAKTGPMDKNAGSDKGPMEELLAKKGGGDPQEVPVDDDEDMSDEELEEMAASLG